MSNEFSHNGSAGKSFVLLLRALLNCAAFGILWYGIAFSSSRAGVPCIIAGAVLMLLCLWLNFVNPIIHRK